jgi:hypothetical protein
LDKVLTQVYQEVHYVSYLSVFLLPAMGFMPELGAAHAGKGLAWRTAQQDIDLIIDWARNAKVVKNGSGFLQDVPGLGMRGYIMPASKSSEVGF